MLLIKTMVLMFLIDEHHIINLHQLMIKLYWLKEFFDRKIIKKKQFNLQSGKRRGV